MSDHDDPIENTAASYKIHVLLGMPRAGTTFLYHQLKSHPQLHLPFRRKTNYHAVHHTKSLAFLYEHFKDKSPEQLALDTDTLSFLNDAAYDRFVEFDQRFGHIGKVILVVRDPASWSYSLYRQIASFIRHVPSFADYLNDGYVLVEDGGEVFFHFYDGKLQERIEQIERDFKDRLLLLPYSMIARDPKAFLRLIENFLEVAHHAYGDEKLGRKINAANRTNNRILTNFLRQPWIISILKFLPRRFVFKAREAYDLFVSKQVEPGSPKSSPDKEQLQLARKYYERDMAFFDELEARLNAQL
jgi:hypothetical protein